MDGSIDDLAGLLSPPPGTKVHFGQGFVESWDARELENTVLWKGARLHDLPTVSGLSALTIDRGDSVALLGWENQNGVSTWWVTGRVVPPGEEASNLTVRGGNLGVGSGGSLFALYASGQMGVQFGPIWSVVTGEYVGHGLMVQADGPTAEDRPDVFRARYDADGERRVIIGETPASTGRVEAFHSYALSQQHYAYGSMDFQSFGSDIDVTSGEILRLQGGNEVRIGSPGNIQALSTGGMAGFGGTSGTFLSRQDGGSVSANVHMTTDGQILRVGSTERIKRDIQDLTIDPGAVLQIQPRSWLPGPVERHCPDWIHEQHDGEECHAGEVIEPSEDAPRQVGLIAEELVELGLTDFVEYDDQDRPASIHYDRLTAALIPVLQRQQDQIDALTARLEALEQT